MRKIFILVMLGVVSLMSSCGHKIGQGSKKETTDVKLTSYEELIDAKDKLLNEKPWNRQLFDALLNSTYSLQQYEAISYHKAVSVYEGVLEGSAYMVWVAVDSTMKTPVYNNLGAWEKLRKEIADSTAAYKRIYDEIDSPNENLQKVSSMMTAYRSVLKLSKSTFAQTPRSITRYSVDYKSTENAIKRNKYWATYFSHNAEIKQNISQFPARWKNARDAYYQRLKSEIMERAERENITRSQLQRACNRFENITSNSSYAKQLKAFLNNYPENSSQEESYSSFWK